MSLVNKTTYETMDSTFARDDKMTVLVIGKSGNGKSALCNAILGRNEFALGRGVSSTTVKTQYATTSKGGQILKVIDTPDLTNVEMDMSQMEAEIGLWKRLTHARPSIVLLAIRCDGRYTPEEYAIYRQLKQLWGDDLTKRLVVAFTFGDRQDQDIDQEIRGSGQQLQNVPKDARNRYFVFDKTSQKSRENVVYTVIGLAEKMERDSAGLFSTSSTRMPFILGLLLLVAIVCCIIFAVLKIREGAITVGVFGIVILFALVSVVCKQKGYCNI